MQIASAATAEARQNIVPMATRHVSDCNGSRFGID